MTASSPTPSTSVSAAPSARPTTPSAEATFNSIKALIIKSADIVNAYYEEINKRLEGTYVAQSDFGKFSEYTTGEFSATSTNIIQAYTDVQTVETKLDNTKVGIEDNLGTLSGDINQLGQSLSDAKGNIDGKIGEVKSTAETAYKKLQEITANIRSGLLYDGVYGIEVGQTTSVDGEAVFDKFARFTADRLSFYDHNGSEVAYISDYKLYITDAEVKGTLKLGGYRIDTTNGLTFKWVGRG
jgi:hypothetical protein